MEMESIASANVQILVHTTAPSRGQDDSRYRALARAYIDYEPADGKTIRGESEDIDYGVEEVSSQLLQELLQSTQSERESEASYQPEEDLESESVPTTSKETQDRDVTIPKTTRWTYSPPMSFRSVLGNADSPRIGEGPLLFHASLPVQLSQSSQVSWQQAPSTVADSQPEVTHPVPSPSRVWEILGQRLGTPEGASRKSRLRNDVVEESPQLPNLNVRLQQSRSEVVQPYTSASSDPVSSPSSKNMAGSQQVLQSKSPNIPSQEHQSSLKRKESSLTSGLENESSIVAELQISSPIIASDVAENPRKRLCTEESRVQPDLSTITSSMATEVATPRSATAKSEWADKLELRSAPPRTSTKHLTPEMLITQGLKNLAKNMPRDALYQPKERVRELRPMERGYWLVNCQSWEPRVKGTFWHALAGFICKGHGGWGISGVRDEAFESVRIYCWGITVEHVYLLLIMSSEKKVIGTGARWIAGDGQDIIVMPS